MDEGYYWSQFNSMGEDEEQQIPMRHPEFVHVLYLQVGSEVSGPTTVFTNASWGGDVLRNYPTVTSNPSSTPSSHGLIVVPAVPRRLLQFHGDLLHAVPRPADIWLTTSASQWDTAFLQSRKHEPISEYGRSFLLFNVYPAKEGNLAKHVKVRQQIDTSTESKVASQNHRQRRGGRLCNNHTAWLPVSIDTYSLSSTTKASDPLKVESIRASGSIENVFLHALVHVAYQQAHSN
jgi:hypothetical protein